MAQLEQEINALFDKAGLPHPMDVIPPPGDLLRELGLPTPANLVNRVVGDVKSKAMHVKGKVF